jgi:PAS domain S-box-containing protein
MIRLLSGLRTRLLLLGASLRQQEAERWRAEMELEHFFEGSPDLLCIASLDGYFKRLSRSWESTLGFSVAELMAKPYVEFVHPDDRNATVDENDRLSAQAIDTIAFENRYQHRDGSYRWISWNCRAAKPGETLLYAVARDVTEQRLAQEQLHQSDERFRSFVEHAADGILMVDEQGSIVSVNPTAQTMFGYAQDELIGQPVEVLLPKALRSRHVGHRNGFWEAPSARSMGSGLDLHTRRKDGSQFPVAIGLTPLMTAVNRLVAATVSDISRQKRTEAELERMVQNLARSNGELEQFAYVASHDLQEPLRMVGNYTQLLKRRYGGKLDADADEFIHYAVDGARRMQTLIDDLLMFSRIGTRGGQLAPVDSEAILARTLHDLSEAIAESRAEVTHDPLPTVVGDEGQLAQIFQNLISNGLKFYGESPPRIHVSAVLDHSEYRFSVRDNGIGISPDYFDRIFVIFRRLQGRDVYPGNGIGLSVCKKIVERHGGRIWVESVPGEGSTFYFTLRAAARARVAA